MLIIFLLTLLVALASGCPRPEDLHPCTCDWPSNGDAYVTCSNLDNEHDLVSAASSLAGKNYVYSFVIQNSIFTYIPSDAFKGLKFAELEIKDTSFRALTDTDVAFEGLEDHLEFFLMSNSTLMNEWDWTIFRNLKKLTKLEIMYANLESVEDFGKLNVSKIIIVHFDHNMISFVHPFAFSSLKKLMHLSLQHNAISKLERSMLPNPASELVNLHLSYNEIEQFPPDMFTAMPQLEFLSIAHNKLLVLDENTFSPVWEILQSFTAMYNEIRCDCRMSWILEKNLPKDTRAVCAKPPELKGRSLTGLSSRDLWCYV